MGELHKSFEWGEIPQCTEEVHALPDSIKTAIQNGEQVAGATQCINCGAR